MLVQYTCNIVENFTYFDHMFTCRAGVEGGDLITLVNEWKVRDHYVRLASNIS